MLHTIPLQFLEPTDHDSTGFFAAPIRILVGFPGRPFAQKQPEMAVFGHKMRQFQDHLFQISLF